jgi:hypothetical protein
MEETTMSTDCRLRASRANGALWRGPKTQAGKQPCRLNAVKTGAFAKSIVLKNESPACRRAWRLESSSVNYKMDQQKHAVEAQHSSLQEHSRTAIAHTDPYENSAALPHIKRAQVRKSRAFHRALKQLHDLRRNAQSKNDQTAGNDILDIPSLGGLRLGRRDRPMQSSWDRA